MELIVVVIIVLVVCAMGVYAVDQVDALQSPFKGMIKALIILVGALIILHQAGLI